MIGGTHKRQGGLFQGNESILKVLLRCVIVDFVQFVGPHHCSSRIKLAEVTSACKSEWSSDAPSPEIDSGQINGRSQNDYLGVSREFPRHYGRIRWRYSRRNHVVLASSIYYRAERFMGMQSVLAPCSENASLMRNSTSCTSDNSAQCNPPLDRLQSPRVEYQARNSQIFPETSVRITRELDVLSGQR